MIELQRVGGVKGVGNCQRKNEGREKFLRKVQKKGSQGRLPEGVNVG